MQSRRELVEALQRIYDCQDAKCVLCGACLHFVRGALQGAGRLQADRHPEVAIIAADDPIRIFRAPRKPRVLRSA